MEKQIYNNNLKINYDIKGKGKPVILIHGFLETSETWSDFADCLSDNFLVISVDLPGHGKSELYNAPFTMCKYAESVYSVLNAEDINNAFIVGHSMGGYVASAFAENYPERLSGLCLFHSSPFADSEEKKRLRTQTVEDIKNGKKDVICENHAKAVFAEDNIKKFEKEIKKGEVIAKSIPEEGITASLIAMRDRKDRNRVIKNLNVPFLYILGKKDRFIPESILNDIDFPENYEVRILENSGHQGFIEERDVSLNIIENFITLL
ncbi:MAG: alpha/beta hydrolase [Chlorobi bacterium]|nr:alpha/beta hydrolase [Chlorobiota bacterium]